MACSQLPLTFIPKTTPLAKKLDWRCHGPKEAAMTGKRHTEEQIIAVLKEV